ncbi:MAG: hypothetical protein CSA20_02855 [Deltaproteobacteria bacterium]|nr:MAG: hypothetical protein CSB23_05195 [Deltaproteobacteria bacterium]PIE73448.1 MAG: hypothetical protein CSA20_02855 [Deltaproteobacteria bacterium]
MRRVSLFLILLILVAGCSSKEPSPSVVSEKEKVDFACSSFYFLWGTQAEYQRAYAEALEAYEKALICDPEADYIKRKLPVLMLKMGDFAAAEKWLLAAVEKEPSNRTSFLILLADIYIQQEEFEKAVDCYKQILSDEADNEVAVVKLAVLYSLMRQNDLAQQLYEEYLQTHPRSYRILLSQALFFRKNRKYNEALVRFEKALTMNWSVELAYDVASLYSQQRRFSEALRLYDAIIAKDAFDERAILNRAYVLYSLGKREESERDLLRLRQFAEYPDSIDMVLAWRYLQEDRIEEAKEILQDILSEEEENIDALHALAFIAYKEKNYQKSLGLLEKISPLKESEKALSLYVAVLRELKRNDQAISLLRECIDEKNSRYPACYGLLASLYQEKDDSDAALNLLGQAVVLYPLNAQLRYEYGLMFEKLGRPQEAMTQMQEALRLNPDHADSLNYIGYVWADQGKNLDQALNYIIRACSLKPGNPYIIDSLGWVYFRLKQFEKALKYLEESASYEPGDPHIFDHLGDVYLAVDDKKNAVKAYQKAYDLFTNQEDKAMVRKKLDALLQ